MILVNWSSHYLDPWLMDMFTIGILSSSPKRLKQPQTFNVKARHLAQLSTSRYWIMLSLQFRLSRSLSTSPDNHLPDSSRAKFGSHNRTVGARYFPICSILKAPDLWSMLRSFLPWPKAVAQYLQQWASSEWLSNFVDACIALWALSWHWNWSSLIMQMQVAAIPIWRIF